MPEQAYKRCFDCGSTKPISAFPLDRARKDMLHPYCTECKRRRGRETAKRYAERMKAKDPDAWRARRSASDKRSYQKNRLKRDAYDRAREPEKVRARKSVYKAIQSGRLVKPDTCEDCGKRVGKKKIQAHHEDYRKRLEVSWICTLCHKARHT